MYFNTSLQKQTAFSTIQKDFIGWELIMDYKDLIAKISVTFLMGGANKCSWSW